MYADDLDLRAEFVDNTKKKFPRIQKPIQEPE